MSAYPNGFTAKMIEAAERVLVAQAFEMHVRPVVTAYEAEILQRLQLRSDPRFKVHGINRVILDRKETFLLGEADRELFLQETFKARDAAKLIVSKPENCPLSEALTLRLAAERELLLSLAEHPKFSSIAKAAESGTLTVDERNKVIDLTTRLLSPYMRNAKELLNDLMKGKELND